MEPLQDIQKRFTEVLLKSLHVMKGSPVDGKAATKVLVASIMSLTQQSVKPAYGLASSLLVDTGDTQFTWLCGCLLYTSRCV